MTEIIKYKFRMATLMDSPALEKLILFSSKIINSTYYSEKVIKAATGNIWTVDEQLIIDQTYWVVENQDNEIIGCGGWSKRKLLHKNDKTFGIKNNELIPGKDPAKIRAFFVHPDYVRKGIGKELLNICENQAKSSGFNALELVATLSGEKLYRENGYIETKRYEIELDKGIYGKAVSMFKSLK